MRVIRTAQMQQALQQPQPTPATPQPPTNSQDTGPRGAKQPVQQQPAFSVGALNPRMSENKPTRDGVLQLLNHHLSQLGRPPVQNIDPQTLAGLKPLAPQIGRLMNPVHLTILPQNEGYWLDDGAHRVQLARMLGIPTIKALLYS